MTKIKEKQIHEIAESIEELEDRMITKFEEDLEQSIVNNVNWSELLKLDEFYQQSDVAYRDNEKKI